VNNITKISLAVLMIGSMLVAGEMMKKYDVKSGKVEYDIRGSGEFMGVSIKTIGKKRVIFDNYGVKDLTEINKVEKKTINGKANIKKSHTMKYMNNAMIYSVSFKDKKIMRMQNPAMALGALFGGGKNMQQAGESMMQTMGGKKVGTDKVLGYTCTVWSIMGSKQCTYKGVILKIETDIMGIKNTEIATKVEFDISMNKSDFALPKFAIYNEHRQKLDIDTTQLDEMDQKQSAKATQDGADVAAAMKAAISAMKKSGFDPMTSKGKMTKAQEESMQNAMMNAMLPQMKKKILEQEAMMIFGRECLQNANSKKEANRCNQEIAKRFDQEMDSDDDFDTWDNAQKKKILTEIDQGLKAMECAKNASSAKEIQSCMPQH